MRLVHLMSDWRRYIAALCSMHMVLPYRPCSMSLNTECLVVVVALTVLVAQVPGQLVTRQHVAVVNLKGSKNLSRPTRASMTDKGQGNSHAGDKQPCARAVANQHWHVLQSLHISDPSMTCTQQVQMQTCIGLKLV